MIYEHADTNITKIKFMREAAQVKRCHTVPIIGEYNVGYHSFNMLAMLRIFFPAARIELVWAIVEHDAPERLTGDIPAPPKWFGIIDKAELGKLESQILTDVLGLNTCEFLMDEEIKMLATLDILELAFFCRDQIMLGNRNMEVMLARIHRFIEKQAHLFTPKLLDTYWEAMHDDWSMLPDLGDRR